MLLAAGDIVAKGNLIDNLYVLENSSIDARKFDSAFNCNAGNYNDVNPYMNDSFNATSTFLKCNKSKVDKEPILCNVSHPKCNTATFQHVNASFKFDHHIWHKRLAHTPHNILQHINSLDDSIYFDNKKIPLKPCEVCHRSKQTRLPFATRTSNASSNFELVHIDIWGPYT